MRVHTFVLCVAPGVYIPSDHQLVSHIIKLVKQNYSSTIFCVFFVLVRSSLIKELSGGKMHIRWNNIQKRVSLRISGVKESIVSVTEIVQIAYEMELQIVPLEPELVTSIFAYNPFGTETTYFCMLFLCQMGHK